MSLFIEMKDRFNIAVSRRQSLIEAFTEETNAYRLVHSDADGFAGLTVDRFGPVLSVESHTADADIELLLQVLRSEIGEEMPIFLKEKRSSHFEARTGRQVSGKPCSSEFVVKEEGLKFGVRLTGQVHTGIFLDSRAVRRRVREVARDKRVLNLFSYTGGFGLAAARGGARSTTNVDAKRSALDGALYNYRRNDLPVDTRTFLKSDAVGFLKKSIKNHVFYDLVILDPPPAAKRTNQDLLSTETGFSRLVARGVGVVGEGGTLIAGLNNRRVKDAEFRQMVSAGIAASGRTSTDQEMLVIDSDFPSSTVRPTARFMVLRF